MATKSTINSLNSLFFWIYMTRWIGLSADSQHKCSRELINCSENRLMAMMMTNNPLSSCTVCAQMIEIFDLIFVIVLRFGVPHLFNFGAESRKFNAFFKHWCERAHQFSVPESFVLFDFSPRNVHFAWKRSTELF